MAKELSYNDWLLLKGLTASIDNYSIWLGYELSVSDLEEELEEEEEEEKDD